MKYSPSAKLTMSSTPNTSARPEATSARLKPVTRPLSNCRMMSCMGYAAVTARARRGMDFSLPEGVELVMYRPPSLPVLSLAAASQVGRGQLIGRREVARTVGTDQLAAVHDVQALAGGA